MEPVYPYLPEGRVFMFVAESDPHMQAAAQAARELAGDSTWPVGIVLVRDGQVLARAGNGFNRGPGEPHLCPRILKGSKTGEDYDLCSLHNAEGHAEPMLMKAAAEAGIPTEGADVYMYGHWWACQPCWGALIKGGIRDVYLVENAHVLFSKETVYRQTLRGYPEHIRQKYGITE